MPIRCRSQRALSVAMDVEASYTGRSALRLEEDGNAVLAVMRMRCRYRYKGCDALHTTIPRGLQLDECKLFVITRYISIFDASSPPLYRKPQVLIVDVC